MVATVRKLRSRDGSAFVATPSPSPICPPPQLGFHQGTDKGNSISILESPGRSQLKGAKRNLTSRVFTSKAMTQLLTHQTLLPKIERVRNVLLSSSEGLGADGMHNH